MKVRAYLSSLLLVRRLKLGVTFAAAHPHDWLIWEPGAWQPASRAMAATISSTAGKAERPGSGDALCFELVEAVPLTLGRAPDCDIVLNDATVSRAHATLRPEPNASWALTAASKASLLEGQPFTTAVMRDGLALRFGDVSLTWHSSAGLVRRLDGLLGP